MEWKICDELEWKLGNLKAINLEQPHFQKGESYKRDESKNFGKLWSNLLIINIHILKVGFYSYLFFINIFSLIQISRREFFCKSINCSNFQYILL